MKSALSTIGNNTPLCKSFCFSLNASILLSLAIFLFSTSALFAQTMLFETFETNDALPGTLPSGWVTNSVYSVDSSSTAQAFQIWDTELVNSSGRWGIPNRTGSSRFAAANDRATPCDCNYQNSYLETPALDFTGVTNPGMRFVIFNDDYRTGATAYVTYSINNGLTWTAITYYPNTNNSLPEHPSQWKMVALKLDTLVNEPNVRIRFNWYDADEFTNGIAIDDVYIGSLSQYSISNERLNYGNYVAPNFSPLHSSYTMIPLSQAHAVSATSMVYNNGLLPVSNVQLSMEIEQNGVSLGSWSSSTLPQLDYLRKEYLTAQSNFVPAEIGNYSITSEVSIQNPDGTLNDDQSTTSFQITECTYALDRGDAIGGYIIDPGQVAGNVFDIYNTDSFRSVQASIYTGTSVGTTLYATISEIISYDTTTEEVNTALVAGGISVSKVLASSDLTTSTQNSFVCFDFPEPVLLQAGKKYFVAVQGDSTFYTSISGASDLERSWIVNDSTYSSFNRAMMIRLQGNCSSPCLSESNTGCTDPLASNYNPTSITDDGSCLYTNTCSIETPLRPAANPCAYPNDWAMALVSLPSAFRFYTIDSGQLTKNADESVNIEAVFRSQTYPTSGWFLNMTLAPGLTWEEWSSQSFPTSYTADCGTEGANHPSWLYYLIQSQPEYELTGYGVFAGSALNIVHAPSNNYFATQIGDGANNYNNDYGLKAWFNYNGNFYNPSIGSFQSIVGAGDLAFKLNCCINEGLPCDDNNPLTLNDQLDSNCNCSGQLAGCTNMNACNYNPEVIIDNGSCLFFGEYCDDNNSCSYYDVVTIDCVCAGTIIDFNNNEICDYDEQTLTVSAQDVTFDCTYTGGNIDYLLTVDGACSDTYTILYDSYYEGDFIDPCFYSTTRIWYVEDECGNSGVTTSQITIADNTAPTFTNVPENITLDCLENIILTNPVPIDNCDPFVDMEITQDTILTGSCENDIIIRRTFTAIDDCYNQSSVSVDYIVRDTIPPVFLPENQPIIYIPYGTAIFLIAPSAADNCSGDLYVDLLDYQGSDGSCATEIFTWIATDLCGNSSTFTQSIVQVIDPELGPIPCDDNNPCTINDVINADCVCQGTTISCASVIIEETYCVGVGENLHNVNGRVEMSTPIESGTLTISNSCTNEQIVLNGPFTSPIQFQFSYLPYAETCEISVLFSQGSITASTSYDAPNCCANQGFFFTGNQTHAFCVNEQANPIESILGLFGTPNTNLNYQWYLDSNQGLEIIPGATNSTFSPPTVSAGTYQYVCSITNSNGCEYINPSHVVHVVNGNDFSGSISDKTICSGYTVALTPSVNYLGGEYLWSNDSTYAVLEFAPTNDTQLTVQYTIGNCVNFFDTVNVFVNELPSVTLQNQLICSGESTVLTALVDGLDSNVSGTFLWSNSATSQSITVSPAQATTYSVTYTPIGCTTGQDCIDPSLVDYCSSQPILNCPICDVWPTSLCSCNNEDYFTIFEPSYCTGNYMYTFGQCSNTSISSSTASATISVTNNCGCTDPLAANYNPNAIADDGSCTYGECYNYQMIFTPRPCVFDPNIGEVAPAFFVRYLYNGPCNVETVVITNEFGVEFPFNTSASSDSSGGILGFVYLTPSTNYELYLVMSDGTTSPVFTYFSGECGGTICDCDGNQHTESVTLWLGDTYADNGSYTLNGSTVNFNCETWGYDCGDIVGIPNIIDPYGVCIGNLPPNNGCIDGVLGCTNVEACNFNSLATIDDGGCYFVGDNCDDGDANTLYDTYNFNCICEGQIEQNNYVFLYPPLCYSPYNSNQPAFLIQIEIRFDTPLNGEDVIVQFSCGDTYTIENVVGSTASISASLLNGDGTECTVSAYVLGNNSIQIDGATFTKPNCCDISGGTGGNPQISYCLNDVPSPLIPSSNIQPGYSVQWNTVNFNGTLNPIAGATSTSFLPSTSQFGTTTYRPTITTSEGCNINTSDHTVTVVNPLTFVGFTDDKSICEGFTAIITPYVQPIGGTFQWETGETEPIIFVTPENTSTYHFSYSIGSCLDYSDSITVNIIEFPEISLNSQIICAGDSVILSVNPQSEFQIYQWSTGQNTPSIAVSPNVDTEYDVIVNYTNCPSDNQTCIDSALTLYTNQFVSNYCGLCAIQTIACFPEFVFCGTTGNIYAVGYNNSPYLLGNTLPVNCNYPENFNYNYLPLNQGLSSYTLNYGYLNPIYSDTASALVSVLSPGTPCDDNNPCTINDVINADCVCQGTNTGANCNFIEITDTFCESYFFELLGAVHVSNPPSSGTLTITSSCGGSVVLNAPFDNVMDFLIQVATNDFANCTLTAVFSAPGAPALSPVNFTQLACCIIPELIDDLPPAVTTCQNSNNTPLTVGVSGTDYFINWYVSELPNGPFSLISGANSTTYYPPTDVASTMYYRCIVTVSALACEVGDVFGGPYISTTCAYTVTPGNTSPTFGNFGPYCIGSTIPPLPNTSTNGITGNWSPAINNQATTTYTFTPSVGQCASSITRTITINSNVIPTFNAVSAYCSGSNIPALPTTSNNGVTGSWSPAINNTQTTSYTFTPDANQCASQVFLTIAITPGTTPAFGTFGPYCAGSTIPPLPTTSTNGIQGSWSPAINNQATSTYTFTPNAGQCATSVTTTIIINSATIPSFTFVNEFCAGSSITALPTTSNNGIQGTWSPAINNQATTTYTFTPSAGQCASSITRTITINSNVIPTFNAVSAYCSGSSIPALPTTSNNGVTGSWSPDINNTQTTSYTFTPDANQCASQVFLTIAITPGTTPTFGTFGPYCAGSTIPPLPTTSTNGIQGLWSPSINNQTTTTYTFTPNSGQCASSITQTIIINQNLVPTFNNPGPYCEDSAFPPLPTVSTNGINGAWTPAVNNQTTATYIFTPNNGECASSVDLTVTIIPSDNPSFTVVDNYCQGETIPPLPTTSNNGVNGSWSPAINNQVTTAYVFTPTAGQCASIATQTITIGSAVTAQITVIGNNTELSCYNPQITLVASGGSSYAWSGGLGNASIAIVTNPGTYTVTASSSAGCSASASVVISQAVSSPPFAGNDGNVQLCSNGNVTNLFNALGGLAQAGGVWNGPSGILAGGLYNPNIHQAGVYAYVVTDTGNCSSDTAFVTVSEQQFVQPMIDYDSPFCQNSQLQSPSMQSPLGGTFSVSPINGLAINANGVINPANSTPGTYSVTYSINTVCSASINTLVIVEQAPPPITFPTTIIVCPGETEVITATGGTSYLWSDGSANSTLEVDTSDVGEYYVEVTNEAGCTSQSNSFTVIAGTISTASITVSGQPSICAGESIDLVGSGGSSWLWSNGATTQTITVDEIGDYWVAINSASGCTDTSEIVTINYGNGVTISASSATTFCEGGSVTLTAEPDDLIYAWGTGATSQSITVTESGYYQVSTVNPNGCGGVAHVIVSVIPYPNGLTIPPPTLCGGASATLCASPADEVVWTSSADPGFESNNACIAVTEGSTYTAVMTNGNLCTTIDDVLVETIPFYVYYLDNDGDGFGNDQDTIHACEAPVGYDSDPGDCDDTNAAINAVANEVCGDMFDNNCDGVVNEDCEVFGCTDESACATSYNPTATVDDGTCTYPGCTDPTASNYDASAGCDDGSCQYAPPVEGCMDVTACNYNPAATSDDGSCTYPGCTDSAACNFNDTAGCNDGSCNYLSIYEIQGDSLYQTPEAFCETSYWYPSTPGSTYTWSAPGGTVDAQMQGTDSIVVFWADQGLGSVTVYETTESGCIGTLVTLSVTIQPNPDNSCPTGVDEQSIIQISAYPNPTTGNFTLQTDESARGAELMVYDALGKLIMQKPIQQLQTTIESDNWAAGVYTLLIRTLDDAASLRVIKE
jgi:hypothetical protein